ncbi:MAG TPA: hypothetical protein VHA75_16680 [Rugosimonospora sp.]|nr:hypothetical protein [Rugosimonospora sp.]
MTRLVLVGVLAAVGLLVLLSAGGIDPVALASPVLSGLSECGGC